MLRPTIFTVTLVLVTFHLEAQKAASHFGFSNFELDFSSGVAEVKKRFAQHLNRGMGVISDKDGTLLFYTDGFTIFNRSHQPMPNGSSVLPLHGYTSTQKSIIVPKPGSEKIFYIFTTDPWNGQSSSGLYYSEVDLSLDGGLGDVTTKGAKLVENTTGKLSACYHANGRDAWVVTHTSGTNTFVLVSVTDQGIMMPLLEQSIGPIDTYFSGHLKFSPDSRKVASSYVYPEASLSLFDFDPATGTLSNQIEFSKDTGKQLTGTLEFSSDATKLYVSGTGSDRIGQLDVSFAAAQQVRNSFRLIEPSSRYSGVYQLQLGPDGKIYGTKGGGQAYGSSFLAVIDNPNDEADEVILRETGLYLEGGDAFVGHTPNFIQNYFYRTSFKFEGNCVNSPIKFKLTNEHRVDSVTWYFGDGNSSKSFSPSFMYESAGTYSVNLDVFYAGKKETIIRQITIDPNTPFELGDERTVCYGEKILVEDKFDLYEWNTGEVSNEIKADESGWYKLTVKNQYGCVFIDSVQLSVVNLPIIDLPDSLTMSGNGATLDAGTFHSYAWSTGETASTIQVDKTGWYSVLVNNESGCKNAKSVFVYISGEMPNVEEPKWKWLNPTPSGLAARDIYFVNDEIGFVVNSGQLMRSVDGGKSWNVLMKMPSARRIAFSDSIGYIIGDKGMIYKSTHLGAGWNIINAGTAENFTSLSVIDQDTIRITSSNRLFSSNDGGRTWEINTVPGISIIDSNFTSAETGHVAGNNGTIRKTIDGGKSWYSTLTSNVIPSDFFRITFVNENLGFASREHSELFRTTDGGETWNATTYISDAAYSIHFVNDRVGFLAGEHGAIHKTMDGGNTWSWVGAGRIWANDLYSIFFVNEKQGYATGMRGRIIKTVDGGVSWTPYSSTYGLISQLDFPSESSGYALAGNEFFKTTNGGIDWTRTASPPASYTSCFDIVTSEIGYAGAGGGIGYAYNLYKTLDGGKSWQKQNQIQLGNINTIHFINEQTGFISGSVTYKTTDGGHTLRAVASVPFGQIQFLSPLIGYARNTGSYYNRIYKTVDGGDTWSIVFELTDDITAFNFTNESEGYLVGDASMMYRTMDGGVSWQKLMVPYGYYIDVAFLTMDLGFILDDYGMLYQTDDAGKSWVLSYNLNGLRNILVNKTNVYIYGDFGSILVSEISLDEIIKMGSLSVSAITNSKATVSSSVNLNVPFDHIYVTLEIGRQSAVYDKKYEMGNMQGLLDTPISFRLEDLDAGTKYYCRMKLSNGKEAVVSNELVFKTGTVTSTHEKELFGISVYPNPTRHSVIIDCGALNYPIAYEILSLKGELFMQGTIHSLENIDLSTLGTGLYVLRLTQGSKKLTTKIVKE